MTYFVRYGCADTEVEEMIAEAKGLRDNLHELFCIQHEVCGVWE